MTFEFDSLDSLLPALYNDFLNLYSQEMSKGSESKQIKDVLIKCNNIQNKSDML